MRKCIGAKCQGNQTRLLGKLSLCSSLVDHQAGAYLCFPQHKASPLGVFLLHPGGMVDSRPLNLESSSLTIRPPCLPQICDGLTKFFPLQISIAAIKSDIDEVALQGIEFWSSVCDEEMDLAIEAVEACGLHLHFFRSLGTIE